jgi:Fe(3+) dicitrate transport protein
MTHRSLRRDWLLASLLGLSLVGPARAETDTSTASMSDEDLKYFDDPRLAPPPVTPDEKEPPPLPTVDDRLMERVSIFGQEAFQPRISGSAHVLSDEDLQRFELDDIHKLLAQVPGVYVRGEDGYGLRPNIGMRGVDPNRSAKIVLLEDNVLLGPAPYSAPAAYYFPLLTRMRQVEVFKGPAAVVSGPNTVGGAINLLTQTVPNRTVGFLDVAGGNRSFTKIHGYAGTGTDTWGVLVEGAHLRTDGFKDLGEANTGFDRNDVMLKARLNDRPSASLFRRVQLKLGWQSEVSNETYLGLTESDFGSDPFLRYPASSLDRMEWDRLQAELSLEAAWDQHRLSLTAYRHDFWRVWRRLNRFADSDSPQLIDILRNQADPSNQFLADVLAGREDSDPTNPLRVVSNDRGFVSQGVQSELTTAFSTGALQHDMRAGARLHYDRIERDQAEEEFDLFAGQLFASGTPNVQVTDNRDSVLAGAFFVQDTITWERLTVAPAVRAELISTRREVGEADPTFGSVETEQEQFDAVVLPGIGATLEVVDDTYVLAGVHRGFSPVLPGQAPEVEPELSWNLEGGARYATENASVEAIGFLNLYSNLVVICGSNSACPPELLDTQANIGEVNTYGVEVDGRLRTTGPFGLDVGLNFNYTFTISEIQENLAGSTNPRFANAEAGDRVPDIPAHIGSVTGIVGQGSTWDLNLSVRGQSASFDEPGQPGQDRPSFERNDAFAVLDASLNVRPTPWLQVYVHGINLFDSAYVVGRRPFGPRPGQPLTVFAGLKLRYGLGG